jgi:nicotinamide-nucleotide amidase
MSLNPIDRVAEIVTIGDELLSGETVDTNSSYLDGLLERWGWIVTRHSTVPDSVPAIAEAIQEAARRASLVISSGGLGPTEDDLTLEGLGRALGCPLVLHRPTLDRIRLRFEKRGTPMTPNNERQARVPAVGEVLLNEAGTAPAFRAPLLGADVYVLPGVPGEVRWLAENILRARLDRGAPIVHRRTLKLIGFGESRLEDMIQSVRDAHAARVVFGYRAQAAEVHIKLAVRGTDTTPIEPAEARDRLDRVEEDLEQLLGEAIFGKDEDEIAGVLGGALMKAGSSVATAESCTGGLIAAMLTDVPGSSAYYLGGYVTYSNESKSELLGVPAATILQHGAVSDETARAMAEGVRARFQCDWGIGVTGIAGPGGGTPEKPVGTVNLAIAGRGSIWSRRLSLFGDRSAIRLSTARIALDQLRRQLLR